MAHDSPYAVIQQLYAALSPADHAHLEHNVTDYFQSHLSTPVALATLPSLSSYSTTSTLPPPGTLVRFRAMVQDTGVGNEVYKAVGREGQLLMYGRDEDDVEEHDEMTRDYSGLRERQSFFVVSVPGETDWYKERMNPDITTALGASIASLSLSSAPEDPAAASRRVKFPIPSEPHFGLVAKVYGSAADDLKICDVLEFVGIMGSTPVSSPFEDLANPESEQSRPTVTVPALHVIFSRPAPPLAPKALASMDAEAKRAALIEYLSHGVGRDKEAAEWILLAILARIHTRHPSGALLGSLSLNLSLPSHASASALLPILSSLVPHLASLPLSIPLLNNLNTRMAPKEKNEDLQSGVLQLSRGTVVLVDMRGVGEGVLGDGGVRNLRTLAKTIASQKVDYEFPYSVFEMESDLGFVVLSEGKALVPTDCLVYVVPADVTSTVPVMSEDVLDELRQFISSMKSSEFSIPSDMSEIIQADFVARRQKAQAAGEGDDAMSQEDLLFRMTAARLMALSRGETKLGKDVWERTADLDERRKDRVRLLGKVGLVA